jgi:hypothetical protein
VNSRVEQFPLKGFDLLRQIVCGDSLPHRGLT